MWPMKNTKPDIAKQIQSEVADALKGLSVNSTDDQSLRQRLASAISGGYDFADTMHNVFIDFGYPSVITFSQFWNMYRRFGIASNVVELPVDTGWIDTPEIEGSPQFNSELEKLIKDNDLFTRLKGLDTRQRVGRYAGMFMRVRDGKQPDQPIDGTLSGVGALVQMIPLYEGQLEVLTTESNLSSDDFGMPTMYMFNAGSDGNRNEKVNQAFSIHPDRIVIAAEGADNGDILGISSLEASFNSLMDLRKIIGAGGEGFYRNAAQSVIFKLTDAASAKNNKPLLDKFNEQFDDFTRNRMRRAMWTPGLDADPLESNLINPKEFFNNALNDVAAASKIPATILIGQQTGRLASGEDSRHFLSMVNSRRQNFMTQMTRAVLDWFIQFGILPASDYEIEWTDLLALSDTDKLANANSMADVNQKQFLSGGGVPFAGEEIREAAGFEPESEFESSEELPEDLDDE